MTSTILIKNSLLLASCFSVGILAACGTLPSQTPNLEDAKFWQRKSASSALYLRGPKAQQMLHQDISRCVTDIRELENLGEIRRAIPTTYNSGNNIETSSPSKRELDRYDTPQRDGYLYAEHMDYHDFETCMYAKGWERVEYLPASAADQARQNYLDRASNKSKKSSGQSRENVTTLHPKDQNPKPYANLNQ